LEIGRTAVTRSISVAGSLPFSVQGASHTLRIKSLDNGSVTFIVQSSPQEFTLEINQSKLLNLNGDSTDDLQIKLLGLTAGSAIVALQLPAPIDEDAVVPSTAPAELPEVTNSPIAEEPQEEVPTNVPELVIAPNTETIPEAKPQKVSAILWIAIALIALASAGLYVLYPHKIKK
jgi:hypothetical protein